MSYTLIVGSQNWSSWSLRPYVALMAAGVPFETIALKLREPDSRQKILGYSPSGKVPVLHIAENGRTTAVWDSLAICETIAERHPEAHLWPEGIATRAEARSYAAEMHSGFPDVRNQLAMEFARRLPLPELREETKTQIARIIEAWTTALGAHEGGFLFGRFSIADCMYAPVVSRFITYGVAVPPSIHAYMDRIMGLPAMQEWGAAAKQEVDAGLGLFAKP